MARAFRLGRDGTGYLRARDAVLKNATHCELCHKPFDPSAPPRSKGSKSVDHILSMSMTEGWDPRTRKRLAEDPSNLRAVHLGCNSRRGAGRRSGVNPIRQSRDW